MKQIGRKEIREFLDWGDRKFRIYPVFPVRLYQNGQRKRMRVLWSSDFPRAMGGWGRCIGKIHRTLWCEPRRES
jgi:hypothetical protein